MKGFNHYILSLIVCVISGACANVAQWRPHGHPDYRAADLKVWSPSDGTQAKAGLTTRLVVGLTRDESIPPIGAYYNDQSFAAAPLVEVYDQPTPGRLVSDALPARLRAAGVQAFRDELDLGDAVNGDGVFPPGLLVLRMEFSALTYGRHEAGYDALLGRYRALLYSADTNALVAEYPGEFRIRVNWDFGKSVWPVDGFDAMAEMIVSSLMAQDDFVSRLKGGGV